MAAAVLTPSAVFAQLRQAQAQTALRSGVVSAASFATSRAASLDTTVGGTYADQLVAKVETAQRILEQYTSLGTYDEPAAEAAIFAIAQWKETHQGVWSRIEQKILGVTDSVSNDEALAMPAELVRAYVEALFLTAAYSLNMYTKGVFARQVAAGQISQSYVQNDAEARLNMLDVILTMEAAGTLATVYQGAAEQQQKQMQGFGLSQVAIIGIVIVASIAVLIGGVVYYRQVTASNLRKKQACETFLATKDPILAGSCDETETDAVKIAKYGIAAFAIGGFLYLAMPQIPAFVKGLKG